jgi:hypothetical protein
MKKNKEIPSLKKLGDLLNQASSIMQEIKDIQSGKAIVNHKGQIVGYKKENENEK